MSTVEQIPPESRFVLHGIPWRAYETLRAVPENENVRMTYDRGVLEIMSPSRMHERYGYFLGRLIDVWTEELEIEIQGCRTMTIRREDLERGFEPDNCYYIQNEPRVWDKEELDFTIDPPPDLAIEVQLRRNGIDKMAIYAEFGVPEVWRFDGIMLEVLALGRNGRYRPRRRSIALPEFPIAEAQRLLEQLPRKRETSLVLGFRKFVRETMLPGFER